MTRESALLLDLAQRVGQAFEALPRARAGMVTGSVAKGLADEGSDIDMTLYYEGALPSEDALAQAREALGGSARLWALGDPADGGRIESFLLHGVEVQIGHITLAAWEDQLAEVLVRHNPDTPLHKAMEGTLASKALFGAELMDGFKARIRAFPRGLQAAMVAHGLKAPAVWRLADHMAQRDASLWFHKDLAEAAYGLMAALAGLNRVYFTSFQFKRVRAFCDGLRLAPEGLVGRLEGALAGQIPMNPAGWIPRAEALRALFEEALPLIEAQLPEVDTAPFRARLAGRPRPEWRADQLEADLSRR